MNEKITTVQKLVDTLVQYAVGYGFQVLGALITLFIGLAAGSWVEGLLLKFFQKKNFDITLAKFLAGCVKITVMTFAGIIALGKFGITITPFIAALGAMAFGASFAIQGPLSNYGAGLSIILGRPFVVGNTITVAEMSGVVEKVTLSCVILTDEDGVKITIPNKDIVGRILQNSQEFKLAQGVIGVSYENDPGKAVEIIHRVIEKFPEVASQPKTQIGIQEFAESAINIGYRFWVPTQKYFHVFYAVNGAVYNALKEAGITIPFPQREVRIISQPAKTGTSSSRERAENIGFQPTHIS